MANGFASSQDSANQRPTQQPLPPTLMQPLVQPSFPVLDPEPGR
jgi:hypothetical protein